MLIDVTYSTETARNVRSYATEEFPKRDGTIALVSKSALGKMVANSFLSLKSQPYLMKIRRKRG